MYVHTPVQLSLGTLEIGQFFHVLMLYNSRNMKDMNTREGSSGDPHQLTGKNSGHLDVRIFFLTFKAKDQYIHTVPVKNPSDYLFLGR